MVRMDTVREALEGAERGGLMPSGSAILLAVSGGADSLALLYGAAELAPELGWSLSVGHVQHGWREREAERDLAFVRDHARRLRLPFVFRREDARGASRRLKLSPEAGARHVRYAALLAMARERGAPLVATAHQRDDVLESYLIGRERKAGIARLGGPRPFRADGVVRPLLDVGRRDILAFLAERGLSHRRDSSNGNLGLLRNRLRRDLAGGAAGRPEELAREARACREERDRLDREFRERIAPGMRRSDTETVADAALLQQTSPDLRRLAVENAALPFALPGRPPMTGREREQILRKIGSGSDFRFEAGRRIRFERRGSTLRVRLAQR
ncbi:MAG: tRNA lysidine(34) synthetase TilS [Thermoanaerobaculia bacterium]